MAERLVTGGKPLTLSKPSAKFESSRVIHESGNTSSFTAHVCTQCPLSWYPQVGHRGAGSRVTRTVPHPGHVQGAGSVQSKARGSEAAF